MSRSLIPALAILLAAAAPAQAQSIVNIGSQFGFNYDSGGSDPAPIPGQHINFIGEVPTLSLGAGTYQITNATGLLGANPAYTAWNYNIGSANTWTWAFVLAKIDGTVIQYNGIGSGNTQADVAALPEVKSFASTFTLAAPTTVAFTFRDYYTGDNAGGVALRIAPVTAAGAVPEPAGWAMMIVGVGVAGAAMRRRRHVPALA